MAWIDHDCYCFPQRSKGYVCSRSIGSDPSVPYIAPLYYVFLQSALWIIYPPESLFAMINEYIIAAEYPWYVLHILQQSTAAKMLSHRILRISGQKFFLDGNHSKAVSF